MGLLALSLAASADQSSTLDQKLQEVRSALQVNEGAFSGDAAPVLHAAIAQAQYVLVGEDHITREIPRFTAAVCDAMAVDGLTAMAVEAGPLAAKIVADSLGKQDRLARMSALVRKYPDSVAFLDDRQENDLVEHCAEASHRADFHFWGIDQEFFGSGGWILDSILATKPGPHAAAAVRALKAEEQRDSALAKQTGNPGNLFLIAASDAELSAVQSLLKKEGSKQANELFSELTVSHEIYRENQKGWSDANARRARLLKQNFQRDITSAGPNQRVLIKLGDWHLYKGLNPLNQLDLGDYIAEIADVNGAKSLHICVLGAKGVHSLYGGYRRPPKLQPFVMDQDPSYTWLKPAIDNQVKSGWTMYDLRRLRFQKITGIGADFSRLIYGYDLLIIIPQITPADMID